MMTDWASLDLLTWIVPAVGTVAFILISQVMSHRSKMQERIDRATGRDKAEHGDAVVPTFNQFARQMSKVGEAVQPKSDEERSRLRSQMIRAGYYHPQAGYIFLAVKALATFIPMIGAVICMVVFPDYAKIGTLVGVVFGTAGLFVPGVLIQRKTRARKLAFHRALPDAMDLAVVCIEGGLALTAALQRVSDSLGTAHPELAFEMKIVDRSIQMGRQTGEALRELGERVDMEELRTLASVVGEAERLGGSMAGSLRNLGQTFREERTQKAEILAQQAAVKILLPTVLCIFPMILVVVLGPVVVKVMYGAPN
jgi:tight adherence protein C